MAHAGNKKPQSCHLISTGVRRLVHRSHLVSPSKSLILSCGEMDSVFKEKKLEKIVVVNLPGFYLKNLGNLSNCSALKICILPRNYITKIDALANCPNLIKLDLHGNHISNLPDEDFWSNMKSLQILYLHDNIIGTMNSVKPLFSCPNLIVLTLFDTPVSLAPKYRHNIVNYIWSLKALDNFVIADEEVIEDWPKSDEFKALGLPFFLDIPVCSQVSSWRSELTRIRKLISTINNILAHYSPVLIIQRWFRGFLVRKKLRAVLTPCKQQALPERWVNGELCSRGIHVLEDGSMWAAGSSNKQDDQCSAVHLEIDKNKLNIKLLEDRCELNEITSGIYPCILQWNRWKSPNFKPKQNIFRHRAFREPNIVPFPDKFELEPLAGEEEEEEEEEEDEEEGKEDADKDIHEILKLYQIIRRPTLAHEMLLSRLASGEDIRQGIQQIHEMLRNKPQPKFTYKPPVSLDMRLYTKSHGSVSLAPFLAIQKAYGDREIVAKQQLLTDQTRKQKAAEDQSRSNLHSQARQKCDASLRKYKEDKLHGEQVLLQRKRDEAKSLMLIRHNNYLFLAEKSCQELDHQLVKKFSCSYTMLSEASLKRQIREQNENIRQQKLDLAQSIKRKAKLLKKEIRDFMMHKQLTMQAENAAARKAANTILSQASRDRLLQARASVAAQKARQRTAETTGPATTEQDATHPEKLPGISPQLTLTQSEAHAPEI
ncbi:leucine-rich repeat and IQ domain-containing protein 3-like [Carcharodon carcharias]|uniref:leucine-rich repeat and IQ domain-containing protein 3-like n=1 Tax=Carcharodon carcharias TaxID=13397 RepID=UPI001B7E0B1B|nr:leucine-rich repeat and IQ domain-containing protein 3-like [Carcharodon carcharias]